MVRYGRTAGGLVDGGRWKMQRKVLYFLSVRPALSLFYARLGLPWSAKTHAYDSCTFLMWAQMRMGEIDSGTEYVK